MPKLIINGTNDFYWATDALNLYWNGIPADKWVLYVPNAGHNLRRQDRPQPDQLNDLIDGLAAFSRHQISGTPMPNLSWKHENVNGKLRLTIAATPAPTGARLWIAQTPTTDFRTAKWSEQEVSLSNGKIVGEVTPPGGDEVSRLHRRQNAEAALGFDGQRSLRGELPFRADLPKRGAAAKVGCVTYTSEGLAYHRKHAHDEELRRPSIR